MFTIDGREVEVCEVWVCACSGGCGGEWTAHCAVKGGEYRTEVQDAVTGITVATLCDDEADAARLVHVWGWRDLGGGFLARPGLAA